MRDLARHLGREAEIRRHAGRPACVGCGAVRSVEGGVNLHSRKTAGIAFEVATAPGKGSCMLLWDAPASGADKRTAQWLPPITGVGRQRSVDFIVLQPPVRRWVQPRCSPLGRQAVVPVVRFGRDAVRHGQKRPEAAGLQRRKQHVKRTIGDHKPGTIRIDAWRSLRSQIEGYANRLAPKTHRTTRAVTVIVVQATGSPSSRPARDRVAWTGRRA